MYNAQPLAVDFSQAPVAVDLDMIRCLRRHLHSIKKTFTGKEFVDNLLALSVQEDSSESTSSEMINHHQSICYSNEYAIELGQYLLDSGLLSVVATMLHTTPNPSEVEASIENSHDNRMFRLMSSYRFTEAEDRQANIRKHQVLQAVREKTNKKGQQSSEERGRLGTLLLISDILLQRSQFEKRLLDFIKSNKFQEVTRQLGNSTATCLTIVHL